MVARHPRGFIAAMLAIAVVFWTGMGATAVLAHQIFDDVPDGSVLSRVTQMARASVFYDHKGQPAFTIFKEQRLEVPFAQMSPHLKAAMLAIEDQRFYEHQGVDVIRVAGAALANLRQGGRAQGASTITQQLARMSFLSVDKTYARKLQEVLLAARLESEYSKEQIFELYLNKAYFGSGLYGAEAAALGYFGKHASELNLAESALIAGLVKAPSSYAPTVSIDRAVKRRAVVLAQMRAMGTIDDKTLSQANAAKVTLVDALRKEEPYGRFFKEHVRKELIARFGEELVYEGGLRVHTTIDLEMQRAADAQVQRALADLDRRRQARKGSNPATLQASLMAIDPRSGEVRAMIGGRDFVDSNYNRAVLAKRQPGSAFKPFVYAAALEAGYTPASLISGLNSPIATPQGAWIPEDDHSSADSMTMRAALKTSSNRAAVQMIQDVGINKAVAYAERIGVGTMPRVPSAALGAGEVTLESLTTAYGVFANAGTRHSPIYITRVEDQQGQLLYSARSEGKQVVNPQTAFLMTEMLQDVIDHGTAWKARQLGFKLPAAGKTGTTNEYRDAWFVGYTPRLVTGVWVGFDQPDTILGGGYAAEVAVPLWAGFMRQATAKDPPEWYKAPAGIVTASVCRLSGKLPSEGCYGSLTEASDGKMVSSSTIYTEYFVRGSVPEELCPIHTRAIEGRSRWWSGLFSSASSSRSSESRPEPAQEEAHAVEADRDAAEEAPVAKEPEKKRGFWSRVFGRGDKKDADKEAENERKRKPGNR